MPQPPSVTFAILSDDMLIIKTIHKLLPQSGCERPGLLRVMLATPILMETARYDCLTVFLHTMSWSV